MWHLTNASNIPAIFVMQRMADLALHYAARVIAFDFFEAIRTAVLLINRQLNLRFALQRIPSPSAGRSGRPIIFGPFDPRSRGGTGYMRAGKGGDGCRSRTRS